MVDQIDYNREEILPDGKLPVDVLVSILSNLPVKSLLRFKSVCKSWRSFISSPVFIKMHLNRQSSVSNILLLSLDCNVYKDDMGDPEYVTGFALLSHNYDMSEIMPPWSWSWSLSSGGGGDVIDSCKGLVCIRKYGWGKNHILWNPATRRYRSLKPPNKSSFESFLIIGLGFVEATNDYKVVGLALTYTPTYEQYLSVYTMSSDSWKELDYSFKDFPTYAVPPTFVNGCIHWLRTCLCNSVCTCSNLVNKIFAFDVENEVMRSFSVPDSYDHHHSKLSRHTLVIKGCLSVVIFSEYSEWMGSGIEIWVMAEYGVEGSWVKQFTIEGLSKVNLPLRSWKDREILFIYKEDEEDPKLMFYEPFSKRKIFFELGLFFPDSRLAFDYVESLAPV